MQIEVPASQAPMQAYVQRRWNEDPAKTYAFAHVYIGDARVFTLDVKEYDTEEWTDEDLSVKALTAFGRMLALKIGD